MSTFGRYAWWPYVFMVSALFIFLCVLLVACRKWLIRKYHQRFNDSSVTGTGITSPETEATSANQEEEENERENTTSPSQVIQIFTLQERPTGRTNRGFTTDPESGVETSTELGGPVIYRMMPPPYSDKPPLYEDIFKENALDTDEGQVEEETTINSSSDVTSGVPEVSTPDYSSVTSGVPEVSAPDCSNVTSGVSDVLTPESTPRA